MFCSTHATTPFDQARLNRLHVSDTLTGEEVTLDPEVNFFVKALESIGAKVLFSCGGHPNGFYISFEASYEIAHSIQGCGFFDVSIAGENVWRIDLGRNDCDYLTKSRRNALLRSTADIWVRRGIGAKLQ
jgi:hypothetical protein